MHVKGWLFCLSARYICIYLYVSIYASIYTSFHASIQPALCYVCNAIQRADNNLIVSAEERFLVQAPLFCVVRCIKATCKNLSLTLPFDPWRLCTWGEYLPGFHAALQIYSSHNNWPKVRASGLTAGLKTFINTWEIKPRGGVSRTTCSCESWRSWQQKAGYWFAWQWCGLELKIPPWRLPHTFAARSLKTLLQSW